MTTPAVKAIVSRLAQLRLLPVVVIDDASNAVPLAAALYDGGLPLAEITLRTPAAMESLRRIAAERPDVLVGAGTVITPRLAAEAHAAGAKFVVAPGFNPAVVDYCLAHDLPVIPGVATPSDIEAALMRGLDVLKLFPAEPLGGVEYLRALAGPYHMVRFVPTGGITSALLPRYLGQHAVLACGGSWMAPPAWIAERGFDRIRDETAAAVQLSAVTAFAGGAR